MYSTKSSHYNVITGVIKPMDIFEQKMYMIDKTDLVMYYPFRNGTYDALNVKDYNMSPSGVYDASSNVLNLVYNNSLNLGTDNYMKINKSFIPSLSGLSFCCYITATALLNTSVFTIGVGNNPATSAYLLTRYFGNNKFYLAVGTNIIDTGIIYDVNAKYSIVWTLSYAAYSASGISGSIWKLYINGILSYTNSTGNYLQITTQNTNFLGNAPWSNASSLQGTIQDFRVYNKVLSQKEISILYSNLIDLLFRYKFENNFLDSTGIYTLTVGGSISPTFSTGQGAGFSAQFINTDSTNILNRWLKIPSFSLGTSGITISFYAKANNLLENNPFLFNWNDKLGMFYGGGNSIALKLLGNNYITTGNTDGTDNTFHFYAITWDIMNKFLFYRDNVLIRTITATYSDITFSNATISAADTSKKNFVIDDFRFYKSVLSLDNIIYLQTLDL